MFHFKHTTSDQVTCQTTTTSEQIEKYFRLMLIFFFEELQKIKYKMSEVWQIA